MLLPGSLLDMLLFLGALKPFIAPLLLLSTLLGLFILVLLLLLGALRLLLLLL